MFNPTKSTKYRKRYLENLLTNSSIIYQVIGKGIDANWFFFYSHICFVCFNKLGMDFHIVRKMATFAQLTSICCVENFSVSTYKPHRNIITASTRYIYVLFLKSLRSCYLHPWQCVIRTAVILCQISGWVSLCRIVVYATLFWQLTKSHNLIFGGVTAVLTSSLAALRQHLFWVAHNDSSTVCK